jgi:polyferredoxin
MATHSQPLSVLSGRVKPRKRGLKALLTHNNFRRIIQLSFASFIAYLIVQHTLVGENSAAVTASAEAYCPFGGLETLYKYITGGGAFVSHTHLSNVVVLVAVLVTALLFRSAFCGWICPLGFLQDMVSKLSSFLQKRIPGLKRAFTRLRGQGTYWAGLDHYLRYLKYIILVWAIAGAAYYGYMVFRDYDPWAALLNILEFSLTPGVMILAGILVAAFFVERPWCRYACPLGAASGLLGKLSPVYLKREESACKVCQLCTKACPMGLPVHTATTIKSVDCISCLECVGACPRNGALEVNFDFPLISK